MQFKVGDRVEVLEPADGLIGGRANNLGLGIVEDVDAFQVRVKVEANDQAWWYDIKSVRPLIPAGATTIKQEAPPTTVADLTIPSITVGTQVRLTGVVRRIEEASGEPPYTDWVAVKIDGSWESPVGIAIGSVEVIRQPFKRGEVVWFTGPLVGGDQGKRVVVDDEADDRVLVASPTSDATVCLNPASFYERRP